MASMRSPLPGRFALAILVAAWLVPFHSAGEEKKAARASPEALKALKEALQLLGAQQNEKGIEKLQSVVAGFPGDPAADKAKDLLRENGVGEEIRVLMVKREVFREKLKIPERGVLDLGEKVLKDLRAQFKGLKEPYYKSSRLTLNFFDSQARYRENGGSITSAGNFTPTQLNQKLRSMEGKIDWYFPQEAGTAKDRQTSMTGLFYHELTHYQSTIQFGRVLPEVIEEGLATYFTSRLCTEVYQHFRSTERQRLESMARNGLTSITRFEDFAALLDAPRALGKGDVTVQRWYGQCYAIVDFLSEETIGERKSSISELLAAIEKLTAQRRERFSGKGAPVAKAEAPEKTKPEPRLTSRSFVEDLIKEVYDVKLEEFHKQLLKRIVAKYKQF